MAASAATGTDGLVALPEEILFEVFRRVGSVKGLFMFAVTSRRWLHRFTDPAFLRRLCSSHGQGHRARLLGFFFRPTRFVRCERMMKLRMAEHASVSAPTFRPMPGSPLGSTDRALTSFVDDDEGAFNYAEPFAARRGFVLMQLVPRTFDLERMTSTDPILLGLCNPITGEGHVLPSPCFGRHRNLYGYVIITAADEINEERRQPPPPFGRLAFSQLLLITQPDVSNERRLLHSYTAAARSWSTPTTAFNDSSRFHIVGEFSAAVHRNAAHWLCLDTKARRSAPGDDYNLYKLSAELDTARVSLTKIPIRAGGKPHLCVGGDGKLSVACVYLFHVTVWTQQDTDDGGDNDDAPWPWLHTQVIKIPIVEQDPYEAWRDFNRGSMLVMYRAGGVFVLDLEKGVMEKVMDCFPSLFTDKQRLYFVPYEMDIVEFFESCLSRWSNVEGYKG
ncbi:unnamed protein product [Urochloa decumbens]|uniref:DUF7595 domain-containing protein n=1 Tax=Urochloa decumbens TaxID=240449 RepID=A0ABC8YP33_9POAL